MDCKIYSAVFLYFLLMYFPHYISFSQFFLMKMLKMKNSNFMQVAFFRQFFASVTKVDYLTMRHGFINVSLILRSGYSFTFNNSSR